MHEPLPRTDIEWLLRTVTGLEQEILDVAARRAQLVEQAGAYLRADAGFWGWGRGHPVTSELSPVAALPFGFTPEQWAGYVAFSLSEDGKRFGQYPIVERLRHSPQVSLYRSQAVTDEEWYGGAALRDYVQPVGLDHWMASVLYNGLDSWWCCILFRKSGREDYTPRELALLDLIVSGVQWLQPRLSESIPPQAFVGITQRQRVVMLLLLDGMPRKQIAGHLGLTLHTINDHVKALYQHFQINSATELAAKFLKAH